MRDSQGLFYNIKKEKKVYPYLTLLFGMSFLALGIYMGILFFQGFAAWMVSGDYQDLGAPIFVFVAIVICFFVPTWFFIFLLPVSFISKNGSLFARYPFGITRKYGSKKSFIILKKSFPPDEEMLLLWNPYFKVVLIGSLFFDKSEDVAKLLVR